MTEDPDRVRTEVAADSPQPTDAAETQAPAEAATPTAAEETGTRSHDVDYPETFLAFMRTGWRDSDPGGRAAPKPTTTPGAGPRCRPAFPGETLIIPTGREKVRANDSLYPFRPGSDFVYLTGEHDPDAVLVLRPAGDARGHAVHAAPLAPRHRRVLPQPARRAVDRPPAHAGGEVGRAGHRDGRPEPSCPRRWPAGARPHPGAARLSTRWSTRRCSGTTWARPGYATESWLDPVRAEAGQGRVGDRPAAGRDRRDRPRLRGRGPAPAGRPVGHRAAASRASSGCAPATTATTSATARSSAPARTRRSCTGSATTGPPLPGELLLMDMGVENRNLYTADVTRTVPVSGTFTARSARSTTSSTGPSRPASTRSTPACGSRTSPRPASGCWPRGWPTWGCCPARSTRRWTRRAWSTGGGRCTASATCSASTCTTARTPARSTTATARWPRATCSPSSPGCTSSPRTSWCRTSCAASASASRTTCWSPRPVAQPLRRPAAPPRRRGVVAGRAAGGRPALARMSRAAHAARHVARGTWHVARGRLRVPAAGSGWAGDTAQVRPRTRPRPPG